MKLLIEQAKRIVGLNPDKDVEFVLHPGSRGEDGFVTFFFFCEDTPICLAKLARTDNTLIEKEAANLRAAMETLSNSALAGTIDHVLDVVPVGNKLVLFKEFRSGQPAAQVFARKQHADSLRAFRATCEWTNQFIADTSRRHVHESTAKFDATKHLLEPTLDNGWFDHFVDNERHFLGPAHGDLVPANILMDLDGSVSTVVDFENFDEAGLPLADFVGLIVSTGTMLFGRGKEMMQSTFGGSGWFADEVASQVGQYCRTHLCEVEQFTHLLPLYSDRALSIAQRWGMTEEHRFHLALRDHFLNHDAAITARFQQGMVQ